MPEVFPVEPVSLDVDATDVVALIVVRPHPDKPKSPTELALAALESVLTQTALPGVVVVAHVGDRAPEKLAIPDTDVLVVQVHVPGSSNFGQAVTSALRHPGVKDNPGVTRSKWLWLVHDDMVAEPSALAHLLVAGRRSGSVAVVGPKQVDYEEPSRILELGIRATRSSRRLNDIEVDEIDQGQYDSREDVLAVGTAGMLVRKSVWDENGGLDPALGPFGDGLEYGRRLRRAGYRVVVSPQARIRHRQFSNGDNADSARSFEDRRTAQLYNWCLATPAYRLPLLMLWLPILTVLRVIARVVTAEPRIGLEEARAYLRLVGLTGSMLRARRVIAKSTRVPRSAVSTMHASPSEIIRSKRMKRKVAHQKSSNATALDVGAQGTWQRHRINAFASITAITLLSLAVSIFVWRPFGIGIEGGLWGDLPTSWKTLALQAWGGWQVTGDGIAGPASPVLLSLSLLAAPFALVGISPMVLGSMLPIAMLPAAAISGWVLTSRLTDSIAIRSAGALVWAGSPALLTALVRGDLPSALALVALPLVLAGVLQGFGPTRIKTVHSVSDMLIVPRSDRFAWLGMAGVAMLFVGTVAPVMVPVVLVVCVLVAWLGVGSTTAAKRFVGVVETRAMKMNAKIWGVFFVVFPTLVWLLPSLVATVRSGGIEALEVWASGAVQAGADPSTWWQFLAGFEVNIDVLAASEAQGWISVWMTLAAVSGLVLLTLAVFTLGVSLLHPKSIRWTPVVAFTFAAGLMAATVAVSDLQGENLATPVLMGGAGLALLVCVVSAQPELLLSAPSLRNEHQRTPVDLLRGVQGAVLSAAALATITAVLLTGTFGSDQTGQESQESQADSFEVAPKSLGAFPLIAREVQDGPRRARVLEISQHDSILHASLFRGAGIQLADVRALAARQGSDNSSAVLSAEQALAEVTTSLVSGIGQDAAADLEKHAVDIVLLRSDSDNLADIANIIDATEGMERIGTVDSGTMWRVRGGGLRPARVSLELEDGNSLWVDAEPVAASATAQMSTPGILYLAETADSGWKASFKGESLAAVDSGDWRQAFSVPSGEGELTLRYSLGYEPWWIGAGVLSVAVLLISCLPFRSRPAAKIAVAQEVDDDER